MLTYNQVNAGFGKNIQEQQLNLANRISSKKELVNIVEDCKLCKIKKVSFILCSRRFLKGEIIAYVINYLSIEICCWKKKQCSRVMIYDSTFNTTKDAC